MRSLVPKFHDLNQDTTNEKYDNFLGKWLEISEEEKLSFCQNRIMLSTSMSLKNSPLETLKNAFYGQFGSRSDHCYILSEHRGTKKMPAIENHYSGLEKELQFESNDWKSDCKFIRSDHPNMMEDFNIFNPQTWHKSNVNFSKVKCTCKKDTIFGWWNTDCNFKVLRTQYLPYYKTVEGQRLLIAVHSVNQEIQSESETQIQGGNRQIDSLNKVAQRLLKCSDVADNRRAVLRAVSNVGYQQKTSKSSLQTNVDPIAIGITCR